MKVGELRAFFLGMRDEHPDDLDVIAEIEASLHKWMSRDHERRAKYAVKRHDEYLTEDEA